MSETNKPPLELHPGGKLIYNDWVYNVDTDSGSYILTDISDNIKEILSKRDQICELAPGTTLNDIFLFVSKESRVWDIALTNCFVKNLVKRWKKIDQSTISYSSEYSPEGIEYLELYWIAELFTYEDRCSIDGLSRANFHGQGFILEEDDNEFWKQGQRINWGLDFSKLKDLLGIQIKLNTELTVSAEWKGIAPGDSPAVLLSCQRDYTLQQILESILWELSFYG